nr:DUF2235 domain-containing protein [Burkholderia gladioli]
MAVRQAGMPSTDEELKQVAIDGAMKRIISQNPIDKMDSIACRLYPALSFFFDGTNNNLERDRPQGKHSNLAKLYQVAKDLIEEDSQATYLPGVGRRLNLSRLQATPIILGMTKEGCLGWGLALVVN